MTTLDVSNEIQQELLSVGFNGELMDGIIKKCILAYKRERETHEKKYRDKRAELDQEEWIERESMEGRPLP